MTDQTPIQKTLARELVALRREMATLKDRETHLRRALLHQVSAHVDQHTIPVDDVVVRIERKAARRFDAKRLPADIRNDPRYVIRQTTTYVRVIETPPPQDVGEFDVIDRFDMALSGT